VKGLYNTLYKRVDGVLLYRAAWSETDAIFECEGVAGEPGALSKTAIPAGADARKLVADALLGARGEGYAQLGINAYARLLVEHDVGRPCDEKDADERILLEYRIGDVLDQVGLGGTSGGEMWPTSFEVFCFVADFEIAKRVISADLQGTKYSRARIYEEDPALRGPFPGTSKV
jgi:hypothetical protein